VKIRLPRVYTVYLLVKLIARSSSMGILRINVTHSYAAVCFLASPRRTKLINTNAAKKKMGLISITRS